MWQPLAAPQSFFFRRKAGGRGRGFPPYHTLNYHSTTQRLPSQGAEPEVTAHVSTSPQQPGPGALKSCRVQHKERHPDHPRYPKTCNYV